MEQSRREITSGMTSTKASKYGNKREQVLWRPWRVENTWEEAENRDESGKRAEGNWKVGVKAQLAS